MSDSDFAKELYGIPPAKPELPLIHTTEARHMNSIVDSGSLKPRGCPNFNEPVLYLFYGRPSYRDGYSKPEKDIKFCPLCFIIRPRIKPRNFVRVYPFDTGAAINKMYKPEIDSAEAIKDYALPPNIISAQKVVEKFFDTNEHYILVNPKESMAFSSDDEISKKYYRLITDGGIKDCDDRKSAIECHSDIEINLQTDLMAIVMPNQFLDDEKIREVLLYKWQAHPLTYVTYKNTRPNEYHIEVRNCISEYFKKWKMINE